MSIIEQLKQQKETPFIHIMAFASPYAMMNNHDPIHIDSLPGYEWYELGQTPKEYALSIAGTEVHAPFIERDYERCALKIEQITNGWYITLNDAYKSQVFEAKHGAEIALHTVIEPALKAYKALTPGDASLTAVSEVYACADSSVTALMIKEAIVAATMEAPESREVAA